MAEQTTVIKIQLSIKANNIIFCRNNQRIYFYLAAVITHKGCIKLNHNCRCLLDGLWFKIHLVGHTGSLKWCQTNSRVNVLLDNLFRSLSRYLFNLHTAFLGTNHNHLGSRPIVYEAEIIFLFNVGTFLYKETINLFAIRASLVCYQNLAQQLGSIRLYLVQVLGNLYTAGLSTTTGMNLCLYHGYL